MMILEQVADAQRAINEAWAALIASGLEARGAPRLSDEWLARLERVDPATLERMAALVFGEPAGPAPGDRRGWECRVCGCTDDDCSGCIERTGKPCMWVAENLCSACAPEGPDEVEARLSILNDNQAAAEGRLRALEETASDLQAEHQALVSHSLPRRLERLESRVRELDQRTIGSVQIGGGS